MSFNTNINKLAHKLRADQGISWGAALRLAYAYDRSALPSEAATADTGIFGTWTPASLVAVAGHFWGLGKAYAETSDYGRAKAMFSVARALYAYRDNGQTITYRAFIRLKGVKESVATEAVRFFIASGKGELTPRSLDLITNHNAQSYARYIISPAWTF
jgi:hypothetical protein